MVGYRPCIILLVLVVALFFGVGTAGAQLPEPPFESNAECIACHDVGADAPVFSRTDFSATRVDYNRCRTCHFNMPDQYMFRGEPVLGHLHGSLQHCNSCHNDSDYFYFAYPLPAVNDLTLTPFGFFQSAASLNATPGLLHQVHISEGWVETTFGLGGTLAVPAQRTCSRCHASAACSACHVGTPQAHENHALPAYPAVTATTTDGMIAARRASTCINPACHSVAQAATAQFVPGCTAVCHPSYEAYHGYDSIDHVANDGTVNGINCSSCHSLDLATEHERPSSSTTGRQCIACHPAPRDTYPVWNQGCIQAGCHGPASADPVHSQMTADHAILPNNQVCLDCHPGADLAQVHTRAVDPVDPSRRSCLVCHPPMPSQFATQQSATAPRSRDCTVCHFTFEQHYDKTAHRSTWSMQGCGGTGCHTTPDLMQAHAEIVPTFTCMDCHGSSDRVVIDAIAKRQTACNACHVGAQQDVAHQAVHWANPMLIGPQGPNYAYWTGSASGAFTSDCAMCHTSNLVDEHMGTSTLITGTPQMTRPPRYNSQGRPLDCASCHASGDARTTLAIAGNQTRCDACHVVHGPISRIHLSSFPTTQQVSCAGCHSADLTAEHNGSMVVTTPSGRRLSGCEVCHQYFEGEMGQRSERAIDAGDTSCTACHATYHDDLTAHLATSTASVTGCGRCHGQVIAGAIDVAPVHAGTPQGCNVCHNNAARIPNLAARTAECASCHATAGVDYHRNMQADHTFGAMDPSCAMAGCHGAKTLPEVHEPYMDRYPQYADTCALCHRNSDPARIDWRTATADCSTCHEVHGDIGQIHQAPDSQECVACHGTTDIIDLHPACSTCHRVGVDTTLGARCVACHDYSPAETRHPIRQAAHDATLQQDCRACHVIDLVAEHRRPGVTPVNCVACHTYTSFPATWDRGCTQCHPVRHDRMAQSHTTTATACGGAQCHAIQDAAIIHRNAAPGGGCSVCHVSPSVPATTTACAACHRQVGADRHRAVHDGRLANDVGCEGCHFRFVDQEHEVLGLTCSTCHQSTNPVVQGAIQANDLRCLTCHPDSAHNRRQAMEFDPRNASMHRVRADLPGMRDRFVVNGVTYTWAIPPASSFLLPGWTVNSITRCSDCHTYTGAQGPHGAAMRINIDPNFPNPYRVITGNENFTAQLSGNSPTGMSMTKDGSQPARIICEKCHDLRSSSGAWSTNAHQEHDDRGYEGAFCNQCHVAIPHGWGRPRLLGTVSDPPAYRVWPGTPGRNDAGTSRISIRSYTPQGWQEQDCGAACDTGEHPLSGTSWPNIMPGGIPGTGGVTGRVTDASTTAAVSGATVTLNTGVSVTTGTDGRYSLSGVAPGARTMNITRSGYNNWSGPVTIVSEATATVNVALSPVTVAQPVNLALNRTFTASRSDSNHPPARAGDGNLQTFWWSNRTGGSTTTERLSVDLGSSRSIRTVEIAWSGNLWARSYRIQTSTDGTNWTTVSSTTSGTSALQRVTFSARSARHVRIECLATGTGSSNGYGIAEFRVFQ